MNFLKRLFGADPDERPSEAERAPAGPDFRDEDRKRLIEWQRALRDVTPVSPIAPLGPVVARAGELAVGSPYAFNRLDWYLKEGGDPQEEPLTLSLSRFESVSLVESCIALARCARQRADSWDAFGREVERLRYRGGKRKGYTSRLHYFSEWIADNAARGNVRDMGEALGGVQDTRPLRYMSRHRSSTNYPALASDAVYDAIVEYEEQMDERPRWVVQPDRVTEVADRIESGDVLAFATAVRGLDVTHAGLAYRDNEGTLRVLQAPLTKGEVEITSDPLPAYVVNRKATGILVARPL